MSLSGTPALQAGTKEPPRATSAEQQIREQRLRGTQGHEPVQGHCWLRGSSRPAPAPPLALSLPLHLPYREPRHRQGSPLISTENLVPSLPTSEIHFMGPLSQFTCHSAWTLVSQDLSQTLDGHIEALHTMEPSGDRPFHLQSGFWNSEDTGTCRQRLSCQHKGCRGLVVPSLDWSGTARAASGGPHPAACLFTPPSQMFAILLLLLIPCQVEPSTVGLN